MLSSNKFNLDSFIEFLYGGLEGYAYLAASDPNVNEDWKQQFFAYPQESDKLKDTIRRASKSHNIFLGPALYKYQKADKEAFKVSNVVWTEFDGNAPDWTDFDNEPSLIVQSSGELNQHVYWRLDEPIRDVETLEDINLRITYNMGADASAWDATQVLRPPETTNYKYPEAPKVFVTTTHDVVYDISVFDVLAPAPEQIKTDWKITTLPDVQDVVLKYAFGPDLIRLFKADTVNDRSASLMNLAYGCAQLGISDNEIMAVLILADDRWEKFKFRKDRYKRLAHIITLAKNKYPDSLQEDDTTGHTAYALGFESFLATDVNIDWIVEGMLMEYGNMLMVGPSGIGKSQITLQLMIHLALGKDFLHYKIEKAKKVLFLSLEMGHGELKKVLESMAKALTDEEIALLETNLIIIPHGETWELNTVQGQTELVTWIENIEPDIIAVDSIGSCIAGNISSDEAIQPFTAFNDKIRKRYNLSTWYIHHMRKTRDGAATQDDVYGNQYLLNRSTSCYGILPGKGGSIKVRNFKNRLAPKEKDFIILRDENLMFHKSTQDVDDNLTNSMIQGAVGNYSDTTPTSEGGIEL